MPPSLGPKRTLTWVTSVSLACSTALTFVVVNFVARQELEAASQARSAAVARQLGARFAPLVAAGKDDAIARELEATPRAADDGFLAVVRPDGGVVARWARPEEAERLAAALARNAASTSGVGSLGEGVAREAMRAEAPGDARRADPQHARPSHGYVLVGGARATVDGSLARIRLVTLGLLLAASAGVAAVLWWLATAAVFRPLAQMSRVASRLSEYDLQARADPADDELGELAGSLNRIGENLAGTLARVGAVSDGVANVAERIGSAGNKLAQGTGTVTAQAEETGSSMGSMIASLHGIADNVEVLAQSAEESSSSILQMATTNKEVAENVQGLAASVSETTAAIEHMTVSIKEAATNIEDLAATAQQTSSSMNEMDVSIHQVETNANETSKLSEQALKDAELSTEALSRTLAGIERIKDSSKEAASVIDSLGRKIGTIGNILNVIDEVAEQTNLLALNAAILAAQSGEHGKGFAVVADEIKDLAERTGASTKEIAELIRSVQDESANAVAAVDRGVRNVEEGVRLGQEAEAALKQIQASSVKSTQMVKAIARATIEQARGSKQVTTAINRIAETVQQIATAIGEQARGSEQIMKSSERMKVITSHVEHSTQEQAQGSKQVSKATESISEMVKHLNRAQKEQAHGSERVLGAVQQIRRVTQEQSDSVQALESAIRDLGDQAKVLRAEVARFRA